jgi:hypothetical protein
MMEEMNGAPDEEDDINNEINLLTGIDEGREMVRRGESRGYGLRQITEERGQRIVGKENWWSKIYKCSEQYDAAIQTRKARNMVGGEL